MKKSKLHISRSVEEGRNLKSHYSAQNKKLLQQDKGESLVGLFVDIWLGFFCSVFKCL